MRVGSSLRRAAAAACFLAALAGANRVAFAAVQVIVGATPIINGDAKAAGDITVVNEKLAFALAVQSAVPYGVPRGALIDLAPVTHGEIGRDRVVFADFIPDHWAAWPNTYQHVDIVERGPERAVIRTVRDWGKVVITTVYTLTANSDHLEILTSMTNEGDAVLPDLLSGLTLWPNSGFLFSVPGLQGVQEGKADAALAQRVVAYDADWAIALHASYFDQVGDGSMDLYLKHTLRPGESRDFDGWLQVLSSGDLAPVVAAEIDHGHAAAGSVHGSVRGRGGAPIAMPVVVVEKRGKPYAWVLGHAGSYSLTLPPGCYSMYATAKNTSQSAKIDLQVGADSSQVLDFRDLAAPARIRFAVTDAHGGAPLDARIAIVEGQKPLVEFLGRTAFFTEFNSKGRLEIPIAPGRYVFDVSSGGGFLGESRRITVAVDPGEARTLAVALTRLFDPPSSGWYSADLHHHVDQAEAVTPPADLARSQLAAGLDLLFASDHDSTANHQILQALADRRRVPFIPAVELSPSWGHFNAYPLILGRPLAVDTGVASIDQIIEEARRLGAIIVQVNHPFIPYGYLTSVAAGVAPGGFNPLFDLLEINAAAPDDDVKVLHALWHFWNSGHRYYLSAGTDTHDVWKSESGRIRVFAHVDKPVTARTFSESLKAGHAYVTRGPLIRPSVPFGDVLKLRPEAPFKLGFDLESVAGLKRVELIGGGDVVSNLALAGEQTRHVEFALSARSSSWYALIVEDARGNRAYSDPIWIEAVPYP